MSRNLWANLYITCIFVSLSLLACESPAENTPTEVVDAFLGNIQLLSRPIYDNQAEMTSEEIEKYDRIRHEVPLLFENEKKGRMIMMGFLFGTFDSYQITNTIIRDKTAIVTADITGSKFLGIPSDNGEELVHHVRFQLTKKGRGWYISDFLPSESNHR